MRNIHQTTNRYSFALRIISPQSFHTFTHTLTHTAYVANGKCTHFEVKRISFVMVFSYILILQCAPLSSLFPLFFFYSSFLATLRAFLIFISVLVYLSAVSPSFYYYFKHSIQYIQWNFYTVSRPYTKTGFDNACFSCH